MRIRSKRNVGVLAGLVRLAQDGVGLRGLLELDLGARVPLVAVRVVLQRQLAVGLLDFVLTGAFVDAKDFVVVALIGHVSARG